MKLNFLLILSLFCSVSCTILFSAHDDVKEKKELRQIASTTPFFPWLSKLRYITSACTLSLNRENRPPPTYPLTIVSAIGLGLCAAYPFTTRPIFNAARECLVNGADAFFPMSLPLLVGAFTIASVGVGVGLVEIAAFGTGGLALDSYLGNMARRRSQLTSRVTHLFVQNGVLVYKNKQPQKPIDVVTAHHRDGRDGEKCVVEYWELGKNGLDSIETASCTIDHNENKHDRLSGLGHELVNGEVEVYREGVSERLLCSTKTKHSVNAYCVDPGTDTLITGGVDGVVRQWELTSQKGRAPKRGDELLNVAGRAPNANGSTLKRKLKVAAVFSAGAAVMFLGRNNRH